MIVSILNLGGWTQSNYVYKTQKFLAYMEAYSKHFTRMAEWFLPEIFFSKALS